MPRNATPRKTIPALVCNGRTCQNISFAPINAIRMCPRCGGPVRDAQLFNLPSASSDPYRTEIVGTFV